MRKEVLKQYMDACALVEETKKELLQLRKRKKQREQDSVKRSAHEFPYTLQTYHLEGLAYSTVENPGEEDRLEKVLEERIRNAERIKYDVEAWLNTIPARMQRIVRYKIFEEMTWEQVAIKIGRKTTETGLKKEFQRFMEEK